MRQVIALAVAVVLVLAGCSEDSTTGSVQDSGASTSASGLPAGVVKAFDLDFLPSGMVADGDVIWAEDHAETNRVYAIDPETGTTVSKVDVGRPCDVVAGFDRIWVADLAEGKLLSIDPSEGTIAEEFGGLRNPCGVQVVDDAIWLAVDDGLARVDPSSGKVDIVKLDGAAFPGSGTPLWATVYGTGELVRIDTSSNAVALRAPPPTEPTREAPVVAVGFDSLWAGGPTAVYRLDLQTGAVEAEIAAGPASRFLVTTDSVWLTSYEGGMVERIDPTSNEVVFRADLGGNPNGLTEGFGSIWVADTLTGRLYELDPRATGVP